MEIRCSVRRRTARRREEPSKGTNFFASHASHTWDPRNQRPELWRLFNTKLKPGESMRVFPLSNWTEWMFGNTSEPKIFL